MPGHGSGATKAQPPVTPPPQPPSGGGGGSGVVAGPSHGLCKNRYACMYILMNTCWQVCRHIKHTVTKDVHKVHAHMPKCTSTSMCFNGWLTATSHIPTTPLQLQSKRLPDAGLLEINNSLPLLDPCPRWKQAGMHAAPQPSTALEVERESSMQPWHHNVQT